MVASDDHKRSLGWLRSSKTSNLSDGSLSTNPPHSSVVFRARVPRQGDVSWVSAGATAKGYNERNPIFWVPTIFRNSLRGRRPRGVQRLVSCTANGAAGELGGRRNRFDVWMLLCDVNARVRQSTTPTRGLRFASICFWIDRVRVSARYMTFDAQAHTDVEMIALRMNDWPLVLTVPPNHR